MTVTKGCIHRNNGLPCRGWVSVLVVLALFMLLGTRTLRAAPVDGALDVASVSRHASLLKQLSILEDKTGQLSLASAMTKNDWPAASPANLNRGYTESTIWLRGELYNGSSLPVTRWLTVGTARLEDVRYFRLAPGEAAPSEVILSGNGVPLDKRPIVATIPVFPVTLAPGERAAFVLRIDSRSTVKIDVNLWEPAAFRQHEGRDLFMQSILFGPTLMVALYALIQGFGWRDRRFLLLAAWIAGAMVYSLAFQGYLYRYFLNDGGEWVLRAPSTLGTITSVCCAAMTMAFVRVDRIPVWRWTYRVLICLLLLGSIWTALGSYRTGAKYSDTIVIFFCLILILSMLDAMRRGLPNAGLFVVSFSVVSLAVAIGLLNIDGILREARFTNLGRSWLVELAVLFMMIAVAARRTLEMERAQVRLRQNLIEAQAREQANLEQAVVERTHDLQRARIAADEANRAKTDFLARISHDLRTPLTSIIGGADLLQTAGYEQARLAGAIRGSARHMLEMVNDLIDAAKGTNPEVLQTAPVYLQALIDSIAQDGATLAHKHDNHFVFKIAGTLPTVVELDAKRLRRMLGNLLDNAAKYTHEGIVEFLVIWRPGSGLGVPGWLEFQVKDSGCGIAPEDQKTIFEPFRRLDSAHVVPGIGLGLAIVREWITQMRGVLELESAPGAGTTIRVQLPALTAAEETLSLHHLENTAAQLPVIDGRGRHLWIVEDMADIRQFLTERLCGLGFTVETGLDGRDIIERMSRPNCRAPDLLLTDYLMPGANGLAVIKAARKYLRGVPVVLLSATLQSRSEEEDRGGPGFDACLLKPVDLAELYRTLARLLKLDIHHPFEDAADEPPLVSPPAQTLALARELIELGAISDLIDWAETVTTDYPECEAFVEKAMQLANCGDLTGLRRWCADAPVGATLPLPISS